MNRFTFLPMALLLLAGSLAFAQEDYTGYSDNESAAFTEMEESSQEKDAWNEPVKQGDPKPVQSAEIAPGVEKEETREEAWQKRRNNISFFMGLFPLTSWLDLFILAASGDKREPSLFAYSIGYGREFSYLLEVGIMLNLATFGDTPLVSVIPRIKLNYLNSKNFRLYSYAGLGAIFWDEDAGAMLNVGILGFEVGSEFSVFGEYGYGQVGTLIAGVKYSF